MYSISPTARGCELPAGRPAETCPVTGIGGNPSWPVPLDCDRPPHTDDRHHDPVYGDWRKS